MSGVLHSWAWICAVPRHGTCLHRYLRHTLENIACFGWRCSKGSMDDSILPGYPFHDACITNHLALNHCRGWVSAVGVVTADSPKDFDDFARGRQLGGVTIVLDSSGGSVNDSIALGRRWR